MPKSCDDSDEIAIELANGTISKFVKKRGKKAGVNGVDSPSFWYGQDDKGNNLNIVRGKSGVIAGSFTDNDAKLVYQIGTDHDGSPTVTITPSEQFKPYGHPKERGDANDVGFPTRKLLRGVNVDNVVAETSVDGRKLQTTTNSEVDIMVVWTKKAECRYSNKAAGCTPNDTTQDAFMALVNLAIEETNQAFINSGVHLQLRLVHAYRDTTGYVEIDPAGGDTAYDRALDHISYPNDGYLDNVHTLRNQYGADVVAMLIDDPALCGLAWKGPNEADMFSVTAWDCAIGYYAFGHEVG